MATLLLADVEGSTRLWETQPEEMTSAIARLNQTVSEVNSSKRQPATPERRCVSEAVPFAVFQLGRSSSVRAWSIWSYAYVTISAVVMVSPLWSERFVGLVSEDFAEVRDCRVELGVSNPGEGGSAEATHSGGGCVVSEPI
jgi:hypothetical protein